MATDANYRLTRLLRGRMREALKGHSKSASTIELLGCTVDECKAHLEAQFTEGMSWANHGEWHIDHIRPCASFDLTIAADQRLCFHYSNLQPLSAADNLAKGDKWVPPAPDE
jgi:Uri superfamily endonuclease